MIRVGIVGFATHLHSRKFLSDPRSELVAAAEESLQAGKWVHEGKPFVEENNLTLCQTYQELMEREDIDAVSINTETDLKPDLVELAAKNGKHVMIDKPMARNTEDAERMVKAVERSGITFMVQYPNRYDPLQQKIIELSVPEELGKPISAYLELARRVGIYDDKGHLMDPYYMDWVTDPKRSGGGELINFGCYAVSFLRALARSRVRKVFAGTQSNYFELHRKQGVEDMGEVTLLFENGFLSHFIAGRIPVTKDSDLMRIFCRKGSIVSRKRGVLIEVVNHRKTVIESDGSDPVQNMVKHFLDCIQDKARPRTSVWEGAEDTRVLQAAYESSRQGRSVELD